MARKGESGKAIGVALVGSFIGGTFSFIMLLCCAPILAKAALKFGPAEYFAVSLLGLSTIAAVVGDSTVKGLLSAAVGLAMGTVGLDVIMGSPRFTFGRIELVSGFDVLVVMIGCFAVPQLLHDVICPSRIKVDSDTSIKGMLPSLSFLKAQTVNFLRSSVIGTWVGLLPGAGGSIASLLSYDQAKKASKYPENFGTGVPDGVVASETANNAVIGGSLIPMLTLGIPGDTPAAVLLAAFTLHGMQAGPLLYKQNPEMVNLILGSLFVSNILMILIALLGAKYIVRTLEFPKEYLIPIIIVMCIIGTYATNQRSFDIVIMLAVGLLGFVMERYGFPVSPLVLGVVLGPLLEKNFRRAVQVSNSGIWGIISRPITAVVLALVAVNFCRPLFSFLFKCWKRRSMTVLSDVTFEEDTGEKRTFKINRIAGACVIAGGMLYYYWASLLGSAVMKETAYGPDFYPKILAAIIVLLGVMLLVMKPQKKDRIMDEKINKRILFIAAAALVIYPFLILKLGFVVSGILFLSLSFMFLGKIKWFKAALVSMITIAALSFVFEKIFIIILPHGMIL